MATRYNPSVYQELRYQALPIIPFRETEPLLSWLKRTGRLQKRQIDPSVANKIPEELDDIIETELYSRLEEEE